MSKPKNRTVTFDRRAAQRSVQEPKVETSNEIPRASKQEIRYLIEDGGLSSTTQISARLNDDGFPCASADQWTPQLVDSALRRQDMEDLKGRMKENRGPEAATGGASILEIKQAMDDTVREALKEYGGTPQAAQVDAFALKGAIADSVTHSFASFRKQMEEINADTTEAVVNHVSETVKTVLTEDADLGAVRRITTATGRNVGEICKKIEDTCGELHDTVTETLKEHSTAVVDACENMALELTSQVDKRFDTLEESLVAKFLGGDVNLDDALGRVVDTRLKVHLDAVVNQFAAMVEKMRSELAEERVRRGRR